MLVRLELVAAPLGRLGGLSEPDDHRVDHVLTPL
jgi:hypothetical protein